MLGPSSVVFSHVGRNAFHMTGHFVGACVVAGIVNLVVTKLLQVEKYNSELHGFSHLVGIVAGISASAYLAPRSTIITIATDIDLKIVGLSIVGLVLGIHNGNPIGSLFSFSLAGALSGLGGYRTLNAVAAIGSVFGSFGFCRFR